MGAGEDEGSFEDVNSGAQTKGLAIFCLRVDDGLETSACGDLSGIECDAAAATVFARPGKLDPAVGDDLGMLHRERIRRWRGR